MNDNQLKERIRAIISTHEGRNTAITARELAFRVIQPERQVRLMIRELIDNGVPILSATDKPAGYFMPTSMVEVRDYAEALRGRLIEDNKRRVAILKAGDSYLKSVKQGKLL